MTFHGTEEGSEDEVVEQDPEGRYMRYRATVGKGRFKNVFKAFDTQIGIDVAWSKINADTSLQHLTEDQLTAVVRDIQKGLELDHPNIIKCYKCWEDHGAHCINLITELFTSGNLRQYRNLHKQLDRKAVKRMARQILRGLEYLHSMQPPLAHGDLRCDKIYVNGHSGEIKIGDLGLATLMPYRWQEHQHELSQQQQAQQQPQQGQQAATAPAPPSSTCTSGMPPAPSLQDPAADIFAFGLCMLELLTLKQLDSQHCQNLENLLAEVPDEECRQFVSECLSPAPTRPTAEALLDHPFLSVKKAVPAVGDPTDGPSHSASSRSLHDSMDKGTAQEQGSDRHQDSSAPIAVGKLRGEDYNFEFHGKVKDGKMHFRLVMTEAALAEPGDQQQPFMRTIDFVYDPDSDTADKLAAEISDNFNLSPTDTEICAAALREWLAKEMPGSENGK